MTRLHAFRDMIYSDSHVISAAREGEGIAPRIAERRTDEIRGVGPVHRITGPENSSLAETPTVPSRFRCSCGNPLARNVPEEMLSGYCDACRYAYPEAAYEAYCAALEAYNETPENYR